jgi:DNA-binding transcriptional MerR regulator
MRISELAREGGVSVPTVKFYLREGLLPEGRLTSPTQAQYDERHLERLRLIRALLGAGGLTVARAREVIGHLEHPPAGTHELLGLAHAAVTPPAPPDADLAEAHALMRSWGWRIAAKDHDTQAMLAQALAAAADAGMPLDAEAVGEYANELFTMATREVDGLPPGSAADAVRYVILGTVLVEPVLLALRRLAQQEASARRFADGS